MTIDPSHEEPLAPEDALAVDQGPPAGAAGEPDDTAHLFAELDALLERMLALPVNSLEGGSAGSGRAVLGEDVAVITIAEAAPEAPLSYTTPPPPVSISQDLYLQEVLAERERPAEPPSDHALWPVDTTVRQGPIAASPSAPHRFFDDEPKLADVAPSVSAPAVKSRSTLPLPGWQQPLLWTNRAFELCTFPLGRFGKWLRCEKGRAVLGWAGVLMLAAAGGLAAWDWFAWPR